MQNLPSLGILQPGIIRIMLTQTARCSALSYSVNNHIQCVYNKKKRLVPTFILYFKK